MPEDTKKNQPSVDEINMAIREHSRRGRPELSYKLRSLVASGEEIPHELLDYDRAVRPENPVSGKLEVPPRGGQGSGKKAWVEFAAAASDMDEAVLDSMDRDEIIELMEDRGIIDPEEDEDE